MRPPVQVADAEPFSPEPTASESTDSQLVAAESWNVWTLAVHHIVLRVGWIFKTESVIIPGFLDAIAGPAWVRGFLPILNRLGQSIPPLFAAPALRIAKKKKWSLAATSALMGTPFLALSLLWIFFGVSRPSWLTAAFLALYCLFFCFAGLNVMSYGSVQGKLIRPQRRGRLLGVSGVIGSVAAITFACLLLPLWLAMPVYGYACIFGFTGSGFIVAALAVTFAREPAVDTPVVPKRHPLADSWDVLTTDLAFRRFAVVGILFNIVQLLFPHYQALGRASVNPDAFDIFTWVIAQNAGAGAFSVAAGWVADRWGNRLAIRLLMIGVAIVPIASLALASLGPMGQSYYWITFFLLGVTPTSLKTFMNYTIELAPQEDHPKYISTVSVMLAIPFALSIPVGLLIGVVDFFWVFVLLACFAGVAWALTFRMTEPRHKTSN